jgi:DNA-binding NtrC family response regulator
LSQVYGFVKQSGGHVEIESEIGRGTTVKLYLPRSHLAEAAAGIDMSETSLPRGAGERVLVVEDDPEVRDVTISILNGLGYRAVDGGDGTGIDGQIGNGAGPIDLVLTDVVLPRGTTGPEIAAHVKAKSADTKVLLMTGYAEGDVLLADGAHLKFPLITKPFEVSDLARKLRDILDDRDPGREVGRERS